MGEQVGQYEIKGVLGGGGMATVYRGEHVSGIGMMAAVKKLHPHLAVDQELRARLKIEAQALARLKHRNIVQLFDYVDVDGHCALITELVEGRTLRAVMGEFSDWPMPLSLALRLFRQILEGVSHAHRHNCLHRDIKPGNIMVTADNEVKILDFGIANLIDTERLTSTGVSIGTPVYMAPEQLAGSQDLDQRADLYSLGMTLWEMLAGVGARPIGERGWRLSEDHLNNLVDREVPAALVEVVRRLVQDEREDRYSSCNEVLEVLAGIVDADDLDEESRLVLAGVGPTTSALELPTFEFEATAPAQRTAPINQTVLPEESAATLISTGSNGLGALVIVVVAAVLVFALWTLWATNNRLAEEIAQEPLQQLAEPALPASISLLLLSDPSGATLVLDGEELGSQAVTTMVPAVERDYLLTAQLAGYQPGSVVCKIGAAAIERGSFRCTVPLHQEAPRRRTVPAKQAPSSRPAAAAAEPPAAEEDDGSAPNSETPKPKIHKID